MFLHKQQNFNEIVKILGWFTQFEFFLQSPFIKTLYSSIKFIMTISYISQLYLQLGGAM